MRNQCITSCLNTSIIYFSQVNVDFQKASGSKRCLLIMLERFKEAIDTEIERGEL